MGKSRAILLALAALAVVHWGHAFGQVIDIKGLHIGMSKAEVEEKLGTLPLRGFTIAGAANKYEAQGTSPTFYEDKLDKFIFFFKSDSFADVLEAVKGKYPALACEESKISNRMGATFTQVRCILKGESGTLHLSRFVSDIETSSIGLMSYRAAREFSEKRKSKARDL